MFFQVQAVCKIPLNFILQISVSPFGHHKVPRSTLCLSACCQLQPALVTLSLYHLSTWPGFSTEVTDQCFWADAQTPSHLLRVEACQREGRSQGPKRFSHGPPAGLWRESFPAEGTAEQSWPRDFLEAERQARAECVLRGCAPVTGSVHLGPPKCHHFPGKPAICGPLCGLACW